VASQSWVSLLNPASPQASGAGAALSTATTATISPVLGGAAVADPAQVQPGGQGLPLSWYAGLLIRVTARGYITTTATSTTATFLLAARAGNTGSTFVTLVTSAGLATGTTAYTGIQWMLHALIRCTNVATSGNTTGTEGEMTFNANPATAQTLNTATAGVNLYLPNASGETAAAIDTTQLQGLSMRATLAGANATIQLTQWLVEALC
jgi:hypothetical protein